MIEEKVISNNKWFAWASKKTESKYSFLWLWFIFCLEIILLIPLDAMLIFFCLQGRSKIPLYVITASIASIISGLIGYGLGFCIWDVIGPYVVPHLISSGTFERFCLHYQLYEGKAVFFGSFFPFPLKGISLSAGVCHLPIAAFLGWLFLARLARFSITGIGMYFWGNQLKPFIDRYFNYILLAVVLKMVLAAALVVWVIR